MGIGRAVIILVLCVVAGGGASAPRARVAVPEGFSSEQRRLADEVISIFENGTPVLQYGYIENLHDGRGFTAGRGGFTSSTGDLLEAARPYSAAHPHSRLAILMPTLEQHARDGDDSVEDLQALPGAWREAAHDEDMRVSQDREVDREAYEPALKHWRELGCHTPLALLAIYDSVLQQGDSGDADGVPAVLRKATRLAGGTPGTGVPEPDWIKTLLETRKQMLARPVNRATAAEWRESLSRCDALGNLLGRGNLYLDPPLQIKAFGESWTIR
jgi:chitosanase